MGKIHSTSFIVGLTAGQREELYVALSDGLSYAQGTAKVLEWYQENAAARRLGFRVVTQPKRPSITAIGEWYRAAAAEQRYAAATAVAKATQASCPTDYAEQASRALGQARYLATLEGLRVSDLATLEKNELTRERLALDREKLALDTRQQRCTLLLDRARLLLKEARKHVPGRNDDAELQRQIDLALEEIEKMKRGEDP